jgi:RNA polymerase sigma-70 factor (ECF subfamily)
MAKDSDALGAITASMEPDSSLLAMVQQGHEQAMAQLFERHSKLVYSVALRVLRDPAAAEDVLQEIFMQIWRTPTSFIGTRGSFGGWLAVVSRNRSIDFLRKKRPTESFDDIPFASPYDLANDAEKNLMLERVRILVAELPEEQRKALELAFFEGLTHSEIAKKTECPLGTVKTRIRSAVQTLGKAFRA